MNQKLAVYEIFNNLFLPFNCISYNTYSSYIYIVATVAHMMWPKNLSEKLWFCNTVLRPCAFRASKRPMPQLVLSAMCKHIAVRLLLKKGCTDASDALEGASFAEFLCSTIDAVVTLLYLMWWVRGKKSFFSKKVHLKILLMQLVHQDFDHTLKYSIILSRRPQHSSWQ